MRIWLYLHIAGLVALMLAHGPSVAVAFRLRTERDPHRLKALLELSSKWVGMIHMAMFLVIITGVVLGFLTKAWSQTWIWLSVGILISLWVAMSFLGTKYYDRVRAAVGIPPFYGAKEQASPIGEDELTRLLVSSRPVLLAVMGIGSLLVILWLMMFRPF